MRVVKSFSIANLVYHSGIAYPAPSNLTHFWNFGVYSLVCLIIQLITGIFLAMHYTPEQSLAFFSVEHIMRDVNYGWLLRYLHANGASMFFIVVYIHIFRNFYYSSYAYPRFHLWAVGVIILLLMILTAFMGYVLPWGQMSFWGATVITNMVSAVPVIGRDIVIWLWGGYSVDNATLNRFFSLHYLLPFVLLGLSFVHLVFLHEGKSNNPLGIKFIDRIPFPYYVIKDIFGITGFLLFFSIFLFFAPNYLGHPDNYIQANPLVTPAHIVPEWYFLPFYAVLRSIPDKLAGVLGMLFAILVLLIVPFLSIPEVRSFSFKPISKIFFWILVANVLILGWIGGKPAEYPFTVVGLYSTIFYFACFLAFLPLLNYVESFLTYYRLKNI
jgi:quinol-cytochrome oxidoreductase complex cytochrome b subunit